MAAKLAGRLKKPDPQRLLRDQRFAELINYALSKLGAERGTVLGAQNELAKALGLSSTMLHRYKNSGADFDGLKARTVAQLAKAIQLDVSSVYLWVESGREAALAHQRQLTGRPVAFSPVELARELVALLERYGSGLDRPEPPAPLVLRSQPLLELIQAKREPSPELFDQLVAILDVLPLLAQLEAGELSELSEEQWQTLAKLLGRSSEALQAEFMA